LAICRKIVERHGGCITARSKPAEGASFIVTLPMKQQREVINRDETRAEAHYDFDGR